MNLSKRIKYTLGDVGYIFLKKYMNLVKVHPVVMSSEETIKYIIENKVSIARYGDGEFLWALEKRQEGNFEKNSPQLAKRLSEILLNPQTNLLIGIPDIFETLEKIDNREAKTYWEGLLIRHGAKIVKLLGNKKYGNASFTRPYMDYCNQNLDFKTIFNNIKKIWKDKNVVIVEGEYSRFGVGNDLLNNVESVQRIICPNINAFESYQNILERTYEKVKKIDNVLVLSALGPTATVLSYDLSQKGIQAIDIGHVDIEYEWYKLHAKTKIPIKGKYVNESKKKFVDEFPQEILTKYNNEIVERVN